MILDDFGAFERDKWSAIDTASGLCLAVPLAPAGMAEGDEGDAQYDPYQALGEETEDTGDAGEEVDFIIDTEGTEATEGNEGKEATEATEGTEGTEGTGVSKQEEHEKSGHVEEEVDWGTEDETDAPETQPEESNEAGNEGEAGDKSGDPEPAQSSADAAEEDDDDDCLIVSVVKAPPPTPKAKGKGKEGKGNKGTKGANKGNKSQWTNKGNKWNKWKTNDPPAKGHSKGKGKGKNWFVAPSGPSRANNLGPPAQSAAPGKAATAAAAAAAPAAPAAAPAATANSGTAQPAGPPGSAPAKAAPAKAAPAKAAPMPPRQVSVDALLQEQVRQQLLTEPGKRASMRRLLSQGKVSKLLKHVSKTRQTPITKLPEELCNILRNVPAVFQVSEESSAVQDVRVSLTDAGEKEPVVEQKNFDTLWASLIDASDAQALPVPANPPADAPPLPPPAPPVPGAGQTILQPARVPYQPKKGSGPKASGAPHWAANGSQFSDRKGPTPGSGRHPPDRAAFQQTLQQLQELDKQKLQHAGHGGHGGPHGGPQPPNHPPPGYKADWKRFTPTAKRVLAPRKGGGNSDEAMEPEPAGHGHQAGHAGIPSDTAVIPAGQRWVGPTPPSMPPPTSFGSRPPTPNPPSNMPPHMHGQHGMDNEGRPYDLERVVVNFANVGATYGVRVLKRVKDRDYLFDYEGVRRCIRHLTQKRGLRVIGVIFENFHGAENGRDVFQVPWVKAS